MCQRTVKCGRPLDEASRDDGGDGAEDERSAGQDVHDRPVRVGVASNDVVYVLGQAAEVGENRALEPDACVDG